ncbi:hypothetical protein [Merismopedia glauca]|nr:hypothetical protein [Merismopedia glauca]
MSQSENWNNTQLIPEVYEMVEIERSPVVIYSKNILTIFLELGEF